MLLKTDSRMTGRFFFFLTTLGRTQVNSLRSTRDASPPRAESFNLLRRGIFRLILTGVLHGRNRREIHQVLTWISRARRLTQSLACCRFNVVTRHFEPKKKCSIVNLRNPLPPRSTSFSFFFLRNVSTSCQSRSLHFPKNPPQTDVSQQSGLSRPSSQSLPV